MVAEAKKHNIRVIMDYVINHTSDQHAWFKESASSKTNLKRDWYIWRDGKEPGLPPNNWQSWFGHSAWTLDARTNQYYYHYFYTQQPDLNWRNPEVHKAMDGVLEFWMNHGVAGFRIDAVSRLFEDSGLHDDPYLPGYNVYGDRNIEHEYTDNLPEVHDVLKEVWRVVDRYPGDPVLVTEADEPNIEELTKMWQRGRGAAPDGLPDCRCERAFGDALPGPFQPGGEQLGARPAGVLLQQSRSAAAVGPLW